MQRHAVEHIITTAHDEGRSDDLRMSDRCDPTCGTRFGIWFCIFAILSFYLFDVIFASFVVYLSITFDYVFKKWKNNPIIKLSVFIQKYTTKVPDENMLTIYNDSFKKAVKEKYE